MNLCVECGANAVMPDMIMARYRPTGEEFIFCSEECADVYTARVG